MAGSNTRAKPQFGIFDWIEWEDRQGSQIYDDRLKVLEYANQNGFYSYHLAEHHLTPLSIAPSPTIFLSAACQRTENIRLGPLVFLLPFYNPLRLLHEICMLDQLSHGRLDLGVGRGIVPMEAKPYGVDLDNSWDMFHEALTVLRMGFTEDVLDYHGDYYNYDNVRIWVKPNQHSRWRRPPRRRSARARRSQCADCDRRAPRRAGVGRSRRDPRRRRGRRGRTPWGLRLDGCQNILTGVRIPVKLS